MREVKFRAWDKTENKMIFFEGIFNRKPFSETSTFVQYESCPKYHELEIMQYTGLKDKNGKEGYEEDWILAYRRDDNEKKYPQKLRISYLNGCFMVGTCTTHEFYRLYQQDFEIIGNIHDDPGTMEGME